MTKRLKAWAEADELDFYIKYGHGSCSCHISPPCGSCTHPGNPRNLEEDDDAWEPVFDLDEMELNARAAVADAVELAAARHLKEMKQTWTAS